MLALLLCVGQSASHSPAMAFFTLDNCLGKIASRTLHVSREEDGSDAPAAASLILVHGSACTDALWLMKHLARKASGDAEAALLFSDKVSSSCERRAYAVMPSLAVRPSSPSHLLSLPHSWCADSWLWCRCPGLRQALPDFPAPPDSSFNCTPAHRGKHAGSLRKGGGCGSCRQVPLQCQPHQGGATHSAPPSHY